MITPSPTTKIDPTMARGVLLGVNPASESRPAHLVFGVPNTSYQLHLVAQGEVPAAPAPDAPAKRLLGVIRAKVRRLDVVGSGGRYVEPVMGRPRRVQGSVVICVSGAVVVDAGVPIHCTLTDERQKPEDFSPGQFVSCDVLDGATFTPMR
ncbi:MAG: hypothetical protein GC200_04890 [Tepidisphaera sp.]|nr:hypothetical protein [Tepidisphaera sp.]